MDDDIRDCDMLIPKEKRKLTVELTMEERIEQLPNVTDYNPRRMTEAHMLSAFNWGKRHRNVEERAKHSINAKHRYAKEVTLHGKSLRNKGKDAYHAKLAETNNPEHSIKSSYGQLKKKPFSLIDAVKMTLLEYAIKSMTSRKRTRFHSGIIKYIIDKLYPEFVCGLCGKSAKDTHHITGNAEHHGKGRILWVVPVCLSCHRKAEWDLRKGKTELAHRLYQVALKHQLPEGLEIDIDATRNITFDEALVVTNE